MANTFALITKLEGQAWIRDADGNLQPLRVGMRIPVDAEIITAAGAQLFLQGSESGVLQVAENQQFKLADDLFKTADPAESALVNPADTDVNALITALNQGQDPLAQLDPTAATLAGGDGAGSTYVRLSSVIENTTPLALQYPRSVATPTADVISGGVIAPEEPAPQAGVGGDAKSVYEAGLNQEATTETTSGSVTVSASDGISSITIGGVSFTLAQLLGDVGLLPSVNTGEGTLRITGYTPGANNQAGTVSYEYTLNAAQPHAPGAGNNTLEDPVEVTVTGSTGSTATGSIVITIVDDVPFANNDTDLVDNATAKATGNVITGVDTTTGAAGADVQGADGASVTNATGFGATTINAGVVTVVGQYGTLVMQANGQYVYTRTGSGPLDATDVFNYTLQDGDGDPASAKLTITIKDGSPTVDGIPTAGFSGAVVYEGGAASTPFRVCRL
ncbi:retention module-containing protein [Comamonas aquatica]|uniref:retention module-containing protein n=1 Tax=Comamonas aquatica TaxID=225991 RepID=UPI0022DE365A|nr:retention module-containing protein [Comamonas aquatica]WBM42524.1 retention module-containing protein [Comamonas aquatica]